MSCAQSAELRYQRGTRIRHQSHVLCCRVPACDQRRPLDAVRGILASHRRLIVVIVIISNRAESYAKLLLIYAKPTTTATAYLDDIQLSNYPEIFENFFAHFTMQFSPLAHN